MTYYTPPGKGYYFLKSDIDAWMESFRVESNADSDKADEEEEVDIRAQFDAFKKRRGI